MRRALDDAGREPAEIDYLCAHATSTPAGDRAEARNIKAVFGSRQPLIGALKSMTGHELWMAGAATAVYAVIMANNAFLAPTINFQAGDEETSELNILTRARTFQPTAILINAAGFGGSNASLLLAFDAK
jgi:3-oxoacyl-[acyl-carrier-protein] synthase-1